MIERAVDDVDEPSRSVHAYLLLMISTDRLPPRITAAAIMSEESPTVGSRVYVVKILQLAADDYDEARRRILRAIIADRTLFWVASLLSHADQRDIVDMIVDGAGADQRDIVDMIVDVPEKETKNGEAEDRVEAGDQDAEDQDQRDHRGRAQGQDRV